MRLRDEPLHHQSRIFTLTSQSPCGRIWAEEKASAATEARWDSLLRRGCQITTPRNPRTDSARPAPRLPSNDRRFPTHQSALHGWWRDPARIVVAAAKSPAGLPGPWEAVECMDSPCEAGVKISVSTTPTASLCRFILNASKRQIAVQQNLMLGMLRRMGILGPIMWAAYWGNSDLVDCERLWISEGGLAHLYAYLNAGIASETGMPELKSSLFGKLASQSASAAATPKFSQGSPFKRLRHRSRRSKRPSRKKTKRPAIASNADNRSKATLRPKGERERAPEPRRHREPMPDINGVAESSQAIPRCRHWGCANCSMTGTFLCQRS